MSSDILRKVTPLVLTYNEEPNIARTLNSLRWAERVIVLDSGSTDGTEKIARSFLNVSWHVRPFDSHVAQWNHGVHAADIHTEYVLALDADMATTNAFVDEIRRDFLPSGFVGGLVGFDYCFHARPLVGSVYPPQVRIFRRDDVRITQPGHTQSFTVSGKVYSFRSRLIHDDRKSLERWVCNQLSYSALEAERLTSGGTTRWQDRLRRIGLMPPIAALVGYLRAGGPFRGAAAARYAYERAAYECLLAIRLTTTRLKRDCPTADS